MNVRRFAAVAALVLVASGGVLAAPAHASVGGAVSPGETTYDRPSIVNLWGGTEEIAWAGTDQDGKVHYARTSNSGVIQGPVYTDASSSTYPGTGVTINYDPSTYAPTLDSEVIAWTDLNSRVHVGLIGGNGILCESTDFGNSVDTPSLAYAANSSDESEGINLYLVTVDSSGHMHVTEVENNGCSTVDSISGGTNTLNPGASTAISGQTSWGGPTLLDTTPNSSPTLYIVWAGTNSAHTINIGGFTFDPSSTTLTSHISESNHATTTDLGSSYGSKGVLFTYCGTNHVVYGQVFNGGSTEPAEISLGGNCAIYTSGGYVNGGVDVTWDGSGGGYLYLYPNVSSQGLTLGNYS